MKKAALAIGLLFLAGSVWAGAPTAPTATTKTAQPATVEKVDVDTTQSLDGSLQILCAEAGVPWGGYMKGGSVDGRELARTLTSQYEAYKEAKKTAEVSESTEDWTQVSDLALYTYIQGHISNRIARNLKNGALHSGTLKSKKGTVEGIAAIDRKAMALSIEWYNTAKEQGTEAQTVKTESDARDSQSKAAGEAIVEQAEGNITWIKSLLDDPNFGPDGKNKWAIKEAVKDAEETEDAK